LKQSERKSAEKNQEASSGFRSRDGRRGDRGARADVVTIDVDGEQTVGRRLIVFVAPKEAIEIITIRNAHGATRGCYAIKAILPIGRERDVFSGGNTTLGAVVKKDSGQHLHLRRAVEHQTLRIHCRGKEHGDRGDGLACLILKIVIHAKSRLERARVGFGVWLGSYRHRGIRIGKGDRSGIPTLLGNRLRILGPS